MPAGIRLNLLIITNALTDCPMIVPGSILRECQLARAAALLWK